MPRVAAKALLEYLYCGTETFVHALLGIAGGIGAVHDRVSGSTASSVSAEASYGPDMSGPSGVPPALGCAIKIAALAQEWMLWELLATCAAFVVHRVTMEDACRVLRMAFEEGVVLIADALVLLMAPHFLRLQRTAVLDSLPEDLSQSIRSQFVELRYHKL